VLASTSICFDLSIFELFLPLSFGGKVLLVENILALPSSWLEGYVTLVNTVPSGIGEVSAANGLPSSVQTIGLAGEPLRGELTRKIYAHQHIKRIFNLYGPSEATTYSTFSEICIDNKGEPEIGCPIANTRTYVLDQQHRPMPIGVPGELFIGGEGVARGYLGRADLTAERFVPDPFGEQGSRLYRTGDLVKWNAQGALEFLGRMDHQVKIRGYRIEPGEIETALRAHAAVHDCAVIAHRATPDELRLVAYIVIASEKKTGERELREYLRAHIPEYMVPFAFMFLHALPLTPNGKLDRKKLPAPKSAVARIAPSVPAAHSEIEGAIASVWKEVLGREDLDVQSNVFDLGGHSLLLMQIHHKIRKDLGFSNLELIDLFKHPTVESLAKYLTGTSQPVHRQAALAQSAQPVADERAVAIIGMAGRFPGAANINEFWSNLCAGVDSISRFTEDELEAAGVDRELLKDPHYVRAKGIIEDIEKFDAEFFGYGPREAEIMDPQQRLFLECAWEALEDAGYDPFQYEGAIGVYAGCGMSSYWQNLYSNPELIRVITPYQAKLGNDKDYLPTRVAYKFNLRGPAVSVQTACSTSLVAIHMACRSLIYKECDMALAGGASIVAQQKSGYLFHEGGIHAPDGVCRAFDAGAQGTVGGNGLGVVLLKRLSDARAAGDHIYAVIKGTALDNDGANKIGYTAPSVSGQARVIQEALGYAGVGAASISYIETHGTGTVLGDPIEVAALNEAFGSHLLPANSCPIGSLKTNIGHLDAAAGVAGLIKTALALKHGRIPPSLHYTQANPKIDFAHSPFFVNTRLTRWNTASGPRRAGVSSFGIGGTNAHAVLEESPPAEIRKDSRPWLLLLLSARTPSALDALTARLSVFLRQNPDVSLPDIAYTLQVGRRSFGHRRMLVCRDREEAVNILNGNKPELLITGTTPESEDSKPVMFMFPGVGAQRINMGQGLYRSENTFRAVIDECARLFKPHLEVDLRDALYPKPEEMEPAASQLQEVTLSMASTFALECALAALWMEWGITPAAMIGHSLGEYAAAYIAGVFSLADAVRLVAARGMLIRQTAPGAMMTVALPERELAAFLKNDPSIAAVNAANQCVATGTVQAIHELERQLADRGISTSRLHVSRALHSSMLDSVLEQFGEIARSIQYHPPRVPFISCMTGTWITSDEATDPGYWVRHLRETVRFDAGLTETFRGGSKVLIEMGPGRTLASLALRHPARKSDVTILSSLRSGATELPEAAATLQGLGRAWLAGVRPNWTAFYNNEWRSRVPLPTYPFERVHYWIKPGDLQAAPSSSRPFAKKKDVADWFYVRSWKRTAPVPRPAPSPRLCWLIFVDQEALTKRLIEFLMNRGQNVVIVEAGDRFTCVSPNSYRIRPQSAEDYALLMKGLNTTGVSPQRILYAWPLTPAGEKDIQGEGFEALHSFLLIARFVSAIKDAGSLRIDVLSTGLQAVSAKDQIVPEKAAILGICRVLSQEFPHISCCNIDLDPASCHSKGPEAERLAEHLLRELLSDKEKYVAYREHARWTEDFAPLPLNDAELGRSQLRAGGTYLIFGGMGQIGMTLANYLAREFQCKLVLTQRSPLPGSQQWLQENASNGPGHKLEQIRKMEQAGSQVLVLSADLASEDQVRHVVEQAILKFGAIHGVIHCAGLAGEDAHRALEETGAAELQVHFAAKAHGLRVLARTLQGIDLDFCLLSSSLSSVLGGLGYYAYAAANSFMDAFVQQNPQRSGFRWMTLNWDAWARQKNMPEAQELGSSIGQLVIQPEEGIQVFERALGALEIPQILVSTSDLRQRHQAWVTSKPAASLPDPAVHASHARPVLRNAYAEPSTVQERSIANVLQELLGIQRIGVNDNFFELGGDSLLATQAVARLRRKLEINFPMRNFFESPTIAAFCKVLEENLLASQPALNVNAGALHASRTIDKELEELSNLSEDEVQLLIQTKAAS
jgi:acyl transferase domain-containing protein